MQTGRAYAAPRAVHGVVAAVAAVALVLQLVLVVQGNAVLDEVDPPGLGARLLNFVSYFTVLSNLLVALTSARVALGVPETRRWRVLRVDALVGIAVTGVVHFVVLRPLLDLDGADLVADTLLHRVVPPLAVLAWLVVGPRGLMRSDVVPALAFPVLYVVWTLVHGLASGFWPYPFTDVDELGLARVALNGAGVLVLFAALALAVVWLDARRGRRDAGVGTGVPGR